MIQYTIDQVNNNMSLLPGIELELQTEADCVIDSLALSLVSFKPPSQKLFKNGAKFARILCMVLIKNYPTLCEARNANV